MSAYQDSFVGVREPISSKKLDLILYKCGVTGKSSRYTTEPDPEELFHAMLHNLTTLITGEKQNPIVYEEYATWWDHFKDSCMPTFFNKWFPVNKIQKKITLDLIYPKLKAKLPSELMGDRVTLLVNNRPMFTFDPALGPADPMAWRMELEARCLKEHHFERNCPYCKRKIFEA